MVVASSSSEPLSAALIDRLGGWMILGRRVWEVESCMVLYHTGP